MTPLLEGWDNYLVIVGSAAAGLTGLTFIVITLSAQNGLVNPVGLRTFITPTIVHFSAVLGLAALLSMPHQSAFRLMATLSAAGGIGLVYIGTIAFSLARITAIYVPVREDWIWNVMFPAVAYGMLCAGGACVALLPAASGATVGVALLLLLLIGIHNAWDIAVWNSVRAHSEKKE
jgi:hypothetical protein